MQRTSGVVGFLALAGVLAGARAQACRGPTGCEGSGVFPAGETLPATATALEWWRPMDGMASDAARLERVDPTTEAWVDVPLDVAAGASPRVTLLRPREGFLPDARYRITTGGRCATWSSMRTFRTTAAAPLPTSLGTLSATAPAWAEIQQRQFVGGHCADLAGAVVSVVSVTLSAEATPWSAALVYEARVDRAPFVGLVERGYPLVEPTIGGTHHGRGSARLAVICGPAGDGGSPVSRADGLSEGDHEVVFRARVAGTTTTVETAPLRVTLRCPATAPDAGATTDAATIADAGGSGEAVEAGCSVVAGRGGGSGAWLAAVAAALLGRRLRRRGTPR